MDSQSSYRPYFDFLRGLAIIFVVGIHTFKLPEHFGALQVTAVAVREVLNTAVPLFFAISGFFLAKKVINTKSDYFFFLKKQISKIYIPMLIWSVPWIALSIKGGSNPFMSIIIAALGGCSIFYFIACIIQYYTLLPVFKKFNMGGVIFSGLISTVCIMVHTYFINYLGYKVPLLAAVGAFPVWMVFFALGVYLGKQPQLNYRCRTVVATLLFGYVVSIISSFQLYHISGSGFGVKLSAFIYSLGFILLMFSSKLEKHYNEQLLINKLILYLGKISFGIYLIHCCVLFVLGVLASQLNFTFNWVTLWLLALSLSAAFIAIIKRCFPKTSVFLGFFS